MHSTKITGRRPARYAAQQKWIRKYLYLDQYKLEEHIEGHAEIHIRVVVFTVKRYCKYL